MMARNNPKQKLKVLGKRIIMAEEGKEFLKMHNYRKNIGDIKDVVAIGTL